MRHRIAVEKADEWVFELSIEVPDVTEEQLFAEWYRVYWETLNG